MLYSSQKLIIAGRFYHHYTYNQNIFYSYENKKIQKATSYPDQLSTSNNTTKQHLYRAKKSIKLLFQSNVQSSPITNDILPCTQFLTFTFAENIQDFRQANYIYTKFIQRFNYFLTGKKITFLKYITVPEQQKRGSIHYHSVFFNLPFIKQSYDQIRTLWRKGTQGTANQETITGNIHKVSSYISKYVTKQTQLNTKSYFTSRNLTRPTFHRDTHKIQNLLTTNNKPIYTKIFESPETNIITQYALYQI